MFEKLKQRWKLKSGWQVVIVLLVFACTGFTVMFLKEPILSLIATKEERNWVFTTIYYILIFPVYFLILLFYGFIFGQSKFFSGFVKKTLSRFKKKK
ncbi:DUF6787 family protein [Marivirga sp.]|jgi:hypothetical protein|uniref:DUF6787 family protein n=1 Tax=Marivirga sp. TaxID=2018662 RepID=UPI003DA70C44